MTDYQCKKIVTLSQKIQLRDYADATTMEILETIRNGVPVGFLLPPLLVAVSHFMGESRIVATDTLSKNFILYAGVIANPATGKTPALEIVTDAVYEIDNVNGITLNESQVANGATIEGLIELLNDLKSVVSFYDEGAAFLGSMGRYSNGGASYDRSVFLELYNGPKRFNRDLKSGRLRLVNPRLNLSLNSHVQVWAKIIKDEINSYSDGLTQRFLLAAPQPLFKQTFEQQNEIRRPKTSIAVILYFIQQLNKDSIKYIFDETAKIRFGSYVNTFREMIYLCNNNDIFLSALYGKCTVQLLRLCGVIQNIKYAVNMTKSLEESQQSFIHNNVKIYIENVLEASKAECCIIDVSTVDQAFNLLGYFNMNKIVLAGYEIDIENDHFVLEEYVRDLIWESSSECTLNIIFKKILLFPGSEISSTVVNRKYRWENKNTHEYFDHLAKLGFGEVQDVDVGRGRLVKVFKKKEFEDIKSSSGCAEKFLELDISVDEYVRSLGEPIATVKKPNRKKNSIFERKSKSTISQQTTFADKQQTLSSSRNTNASNEPMEVYSSLQQIESGICVSVNQSPIPSTQINQNGDLESTFSSTSSDSNDNGLIEGSKSGVKRDLPETTDTSLISTGVDVNHDEKVGEYSEDEQFRNAASALPARKTPKGRARKQFKRTSTVKDLDLITYDNSTAQKYKSNGKPIFASGPETQRSSVDCLATSYKPKLKYSTQKRNAEKNGTEISEKEVRRNFQSRSNVDSLKESNLSSIKSLESNKNNSIDTGNKKSDKTRKNQDTLQNEIHYKPGLKPRQTRNSNRRRESESRSRSATRCMEKPEKSNIKSFNPSKSIKMTSNML